MRWIPAEALDYECVPSRLSTFSYFSLSLTSLSYSRQLFSRSIQFQRSVSVVPRFPRSVSVSQFSLFPVYRSRLHSTAFSFYASDSDTLSLRFLLFAFPPHLADVTPL